MITLPPDDDREYHAERRPVLVVSGSLTNSDATWPFVLACPLSSSTTRKTRYCVKLSAEEAAGKKTWVRVPAVQPLLKAQLQDMVQTIDEGRLEEVHARIVQYLGLFPDADLEESFDPWQTPPISDPPTDDLHDGDIPF